MKPGIPKGTRDFTPDEVKKRNYIFEIIKRNFEIFGYQPIETPAMENLSSLTGKYGEEGDKLLFKVLNNGDFLSKVDDDVLSAKDSNAAVHQLSKRGLRYDLTVPFARFVVMNQHALNFPFKRYQIQPVWRADRPQKGRFQEFFQCDVDVVGSNSLMYEAELMQIYDRVFTDLGLDVEILYNNRKILEAMAEAIGAKDKFVEIVTTLDKLDKMGPEKVRIELAEYHLDSNQIETLLSFLEVSDLGDLEKKIGDTVSGALGIQEIKALQGFLENYEFGKAKLKFDISLARGLSYYTGCIFEVKAIHAEMGSIGGGGRYDNLTETFGLKDMSGVGVSFGAERIYLVMEELNLFPDEVSQNLELFMMAIDEESHQYAFQLLGDLRKQRVTCDLYPSADKMKKMMKYANGIKAPFVLIIGESERTSGLFSIKNMETGEQEKLSREALFNRF